MLYIGRPLSGYEPVRLLGCVLSKDEVTEVIEFADVDSDYNDADGYEDDSAYYFNERRLNEILKEKTNLRVYGYDKGVFVLGYNIPEICWAPMKTVEESLVLILSRKVDWIDEVKRIGMDLSKVRITYTEAESEILFTPEPMLLS